MPAPPHAPISLLRYPGGKSKPAARRWVLAHQPRVVGEYREPFVGGGGVFFALPPGVPAWVNDIDPDLVAVYLALRDRPAEFAARCRVVDPARLKEEFDRVKLDGGEDRAFRYFLVNRTVFGGRVNYDLPSRLYFSNPDGWNVVKGDTLGRAAAHLAGVRVTCGDFAPLLAEPGRDVWCYADPPYLVNSSLPPTCRLYRHAFTGADHARLAAAVRASPHKVALSYGDDPDGFARSLYPAAEGFRVAAADLNYGGTVGGGKARGRELLILNYNPGKVSVLLPGPAPRPDPPAPVRWADRRERRALVRQLRAADRTLSLRKIATRLGVTLSTVQSDLAAG
ncbi:MAG: hypothetical protein C0501_30420 [Isosphaera sp.]|nr:hypothetical protein [Isosphaera sp.]